MRCHGRNPKRVALLGVKRSVMALALLGVVVLTHPACGDDEDSGPAKSRGMGGAGGAGAAGAAGVAAKGDGDEGGDAAGKTVSLQYSDVDFSESEQSRDPFRPFVSMFKPQEATRPQRSVKLAETSIEELKLIAVVSGTARPRAMLVDRLSVGHTVERGDFIGRPEVVQDFGSSGEPVSYTLNWRVDRIRSGEVVLTRENPLGSDGDAIVRVLPLFQDAP